MEPRCGDELCTNPECYVQPGDPDPDASPEVIALELAVSEEYRRELPRAIARARANLEARERIEQETAAGWEPPPSHGTLADELALPDEGPLWRLEGLLGAGHNALIVGGRKVGKTTMVNGLIRAYVDHADFLGRFRVVPAERTVAVLNYELDERQYRRWLREAGILRPERVYVLHLRGRSLPLRSPRAREWLVGWLKSRDVGLLILDPYSRAYVGSLDNGNDEAQVGAFLDLLDQVKAAAGVDELVMPVHTPKARAEAGEETAIGSQRLEAWADSMWYLVRDVETGTRFFRAEGRDVDVPEQQLTYDPASRSLVLGGGSRATLARDRDAQVVIELVRQKPGSSSRDLYGELGWGYQRFIKAAAAGERTGILRRERKKGSHLWWVVDLEYDPNGESGS